MVTQHLELPIDAVVHAPGHVYLLIIGNERNWVCFAHGTILQRSSRTESTSSDAWLTIFGRGVSVEPSWTGCEATIGGPIEEIADRTEILLGAVDRCD